MIMLPMSDPNVWADYGLIGLVLSALFILVGYFLREGHAERKEFRTVLTDISNKHDDTMRYATDKQDQRQAETAQVIRDLYGVIKEANAIRSR